jgi:diguanylate cyclase (GGDEF)-like protein/PAS domain S-box-containing protein
MSIKIQHKKTINNDFIKSLKQNNQFLKLLIDTIPCPIFYKDIDGIYQQCNDAFSKTILGIPKEMIIGKSLFDIPQYIPNDLAKLYKEKDDALFKNPIVQTYIAEVLCADKIKRTFKFTKSVLFDEDKKSIGLVGVMLDMSQLKQKENELIEKNILLEQLSFKDSLTGAYNRRKFDELFSAMLKTAQRYEYILNFAMIDIDDFKLYNDTFGHQSGDEALKTISDTIKKCLLRPDDYYFRLGGEEFGVLFFSNDIESAINLIENIKNSINILNMKHINKLKKLTISAGLTIVKNKEKNTKYIYKKADKLLYKAKEKGKNLVLSEVI